MAIDKKDLAIKTVIAAGTIGAAIATPWLALFVAPAVIPLLESSLAKETMKALGEGVKNTISGILSNLASSAIWDSTNTLDYPEQNEDLSHLLATAYYEGLEKFIHTTELATNESDYLKVVLNKLKSATKPKNPEKLALIFPVNQNENPQSLNYSFANRLTSEDFILTLDDSDVSRNALQDEIEISIRRWYSEETNNPLSITIQLTEIPNSIKSDLREKLSVWIPKRIGELVKSDDFKRAWIAFQRTHLQALWKQVNNQQNGLTEEDRNLLRDLAENLNDLSELKQLPNQLAEISSNILTRIDLVKEDFQRFVEESQQILANIILNRLNAVEQTVIVKADETNKTVTDAKDEILEAVKTLKKTLPNTISFID